MPELSEGEELSIRAKKQCEEMEKVGLPSRPIGHWYGIPPELTPEQKAFMNKHGLSFSAGYIGMLRCYRGNQTVWRSSGGMDIVAKAIVAGLGELDGSWITPDEELKAAGIKFLEDAMKLDEERLKALLERHVPLF